MLVARGSHGVQFMKGPSCEKVDGPSGDNFDGCRGLRFSGDGSKLAWVSEHQVTIADTSNWEQLFSQQLTRVAAVSFSPSADIFSVWQPVIVTKGAPNLHMFDLKQNSKLVEFPHKTFETWEPQWTADGTVFTRCLEGQLLFYSVQQPTTVLHRLSLTGLAVASLSPGSVTNVVAFVPAISSQPASARLYRYPKLNNEDVVSRKTFFRADTCNMRWNSTGTCCALIVSSDTDKTGQSYYGESAAYCLDSRGNAALLQPETKKGPVYAVEFSPCGKQFCMVYGFMPSKAALFNMKFDVIHQFEPAHRNSAHYSPHGDLLMLAGSGAVRGKLEVWHVPQRRLLAKADCMDVTEIAWCPDGAHISTATCAPRLREGNCFRVWHYTLKLCHERMIPAGQQLFSTCWRPQPVKQFAKPTVSQTAAVRDLTETSAAYVPPSMRNRPSTGASTNSGQRYIPGLAPDPPANKSNAQSKSKQKKKNKENKASSEQKCDAVAVGNSGAPLTNSTEQKKAAADCLDGAERKKRREALKKKLKEISRLKADELEGKELRPEQKDKLAKEKQLQSELERLTV